jgi:hypothetical protein
VDVKAILLVGVEDPAVPGAGSIADIPVALLDVLGYPVLHRVADRFLRFGIDDITVVSDVPAAASLFARDARRSGLNWVSSAAKIVWRACEDVFSDCAQAGADLVLVQRVGAYVELDLEQLIQFHLDQRSRVTRVVDAEGDLGVFAISASRRNDAAFLFRRQLQQSRVPAVEFRFDGYANRLRGAADMRQLARDIFHQKVAMTPRGQEVRPGVWVAEGARIHPLARLVAPAFIGAWSKLQAAAVVTRCGAVERHAHVDCGTVIEDASVLPFTAVGAGLDVAQSMVGLGRLAHLPRDVEVEIADPALLTMRSLRAPVRALASFTSALLHPFQTLREARATSHRLPAGGLAPAPAPATGQARQSAEFPANLAVARRYGNE